MRAEDAQAQIVLRDQGGIRLQGQAAEIARNPEVTAAYLGV